MVFVYSIVSWYLPRSIEIFCHRYFSIYRAFGLNRSSKPPWSIKLRFLYILWGPTRFCVKSNISISLSFLSTQKPFFSPKTFFPLHFRPNPSSNSLVSALNLSFSHSSCIFHAFRPRFSCFWEFVLGFLWFCQKIWVGLGFVKMNSYDHALHSKFIITLFHAFSNCVTDYILWVLLGWIRILPMIQFIFARHMFMHFHALYISFFLLSYAL